MSKYTTEVRYICESYVPLDKSVGYNDIENVLDKSWNKVFDFPFPIFNEDYREDLCKKILRHYYTREICEETVGLWKLRLNSRMNEIMPYYNKLYNSELVQIEPLINTRLSSTKSNTKGGTDTINTSGTNSETSTLGGTTVRTGGYTDTNTGTDTLAKTGTIGKTGNKTGTETLRKDGLENETKTGEITQTKQGEISDTRTGQGVTTEGYKGLGGKVTEENIDLFTDTPQGDIANMGGNYSGIVDSDGVNNTTGVPIVGTDTAYLTTAEKNWNEREDRGEWKKEYGFGEDASHNPYKETNTRFYGHDDGQGNVTPYTEKENYGENGVKTEKSFTNRLDTKTYNLSNGETETRNATDTTTKNLTDQRVYNSMTDTKNDTGSKSGTNSGLKSILYGGTDNGTEAILGSRGISDSKLLQEFRETFLNIDEMVIGRLKDLFILLW